MAEVPKFLMTKEEIAKYVNYCNSGASEDSKAMYLQQFKYKPEEEFDRGWIEAQQMMKTYSPGISGEEFNRWVR